MDLVFPFSFYPCNEFSKLNLYMSSYYHRVTKTYFFMHIFSDVNTVIAYKTKELIVSFQSARG